MSKKIYTSEALNADWRIGFMDSFPAIPGTEIYREVFHNDRIKDPIELSIQRGSFGDGKYSVWTLMSNRAEQRYVKGLNGWGQHGYIEEIDCLLDAVQEFVTKHKLIVCRVECNWPFFNASIQQEYKKVEVKSRDSWGRDEIKKAKEHEAKRYRYEQEKRYRKEMVDIPTEAKHAILKMMDNPTLQDYHKVMKVKAEKTVEIDLLREYFENLSK